MQISLASAFRNNVENVKRVKELQRPQTIREFWLRCGNKKYCKKSQTNINGVVNEELVATVVWHIICSVDFVAAT